MYISGRKERRGRVAPNRTLPCCPLPLLCMPSSPGGLVLNVWLWAILYLSVLSFEMVYVTPPFGILTCLG